MYNIIKTVAKGKARVVGKCTSVLRRSLKGSRGRIKREAGEPAGVRARSQAQRMTHSKTDCPLPLPLCSTLLGFLNLILFVGQGFYTVVQANLEHSVWF